MTLCPNPSGSLTIAGFDFETGCSTVLDSYTRFWTVNSLVEAPVEHISGNPGDIVYAPEIGSYEVPLAFVVVGETDPNGDVFDDPWEGIESNMNWFNTRFLFPIALNNGLRPAELTMPSGQIRRADVLVRPVQHGVVTVGDNGTCAGTDGMSVYARFVIPIFVPSGLFVP